MIVNSNINQIIAGLTILRPYDPLTTIDFDNEGRLYAGPQHTGTRNTTIAKDDAEALTEHGWAYSEWIGRWGWPS